ncbi:MAG TPA: HAD family hydrolase [Lachnospiraceae bacterium]|nr:HAD family hydrolase [Lachnospiraceae bacterium]
MVRQKIRAVIFDLDGTLTNSLESIAYSVNRAIATVGYPPFSSERYKTLVGEGAEELIKRTLQASGDTSLEHYDYVREVYDDLFEKDCMYQVKAYDGIKKVLDSLKKSGIKMAVLSNKPHVRTKEVVEGIFGVNIFDFVQGQVPERKRKPSPDGVFYICQQLGVSVNEVMYVGDTSTDMLTGKASGAFTVGVLWGFRDKKELVENQADSIVSTPEELLLLGGMKID